MHSSVPPFVLCLLAIFGAKEIGGQTPNDDWQTIFSENSQWSPNWPRTRVVYETGQSVLGFPRRTTTYRRNPTSSQAKTRILFVDFDGYTWIYSPKTASWTRLSREDGHIDSIRHFSQLLANSITTLCGTRVIAFAGARGEYGLGEASNETWLFNGASEKWTALKFTTAVPTARFGHEAFSHYRAESTCQCKESVIVFGGNDVNNEIVRDFWELQCVDDRNETNMKYRWVQFTTNLGPLNEHKLNRLNPFSVNNTVIYWLIDGNQSAWTFDVKTEHWSSAPISIVCHDNHETIVMLGSRIVAGKVSVKNAETMGRVYTRQHKLFIFLVNATLMGVYDVENNRIQYVKVKIYDMVQTFAFGKIMILENKVLFLSYQTETNHGITLWELEINHLLKALGSNCSLSTLEFKKIALADRYPQLQWDAKMISITDTVWYLMQESQQKVEMWRLELDSLTWTLYDTDQMPGINPGLIKTPKTCNVTLALGEVSVTLTKCNIGERFEAAYSATQNKNVAFFGSRLGFNANGKDNLWIYTVKLRQWSKIESDEAQPKKLTSYATMTSMANGSLLLLGGIDNQTSSLWMITIDMHLTKAKWGKLCCNGHEQMEQQPTNQLQQWSSAIWNNTLYVYFGISSHSNRSYEGMRINDTINVFLARYGPSCDWNMHYTKLGTGDLTWRTATLPPRQYCSQWQSNQADGRFVFTQDESYFYVADLSEKKWITTSTKLHAFSHKYLILGSRSTMYIIRTIFDKDPPAWIRIVGIESLKLTQCKPGTYSPNYSLYPCRPCPRGQYSDRYGAANCTKCPSGFVTKATESTSITNCTCAPNTCIHGTCIIQTGYATVCICNAGFTGKACETPTMYLIGIGIAVGILLIGAFYYCVKRVRKHQKVAEYTKVELEMAEETVAQLSNIWSVDDNEVDLKRMIGQGSFGDVWTAQYRDQIVAVKILKIKADDCTDQQLQEYKDESDLLRSIFHANIVRFIGTGKTVDNKPFIVLEYMERGSVRNELDSNYSNKPMEYELQVKYALDAAKGMRHLHRINRMHRDLKCDNLLINEKGIVKVADMGCTKMAPKITSSDEGGAGVRGSRAVGTSLFRAPEMLRGEKYSVSVDVYSYGIALWEIMTAKYPYFEKFAQGLMMADIVDQIARSDARPEFSAVCMEELKQMAKSCWNGNPDQRPTFEEIVPKLERIKV